MPRWLNNALRASDVLLPMADDYRRYKEACFFAESRGESVFREGQPLRLWSAKRVNTLCLCAGIGAGLDGSLCCVGRTTRCVHIHSFCPFTENLPSVLEACIAESRGERVFCDVQPTRLWERKARRTLCLFAGIGGGTNEDVACCVGRFNALRASTILMSITDDYRRF